MSDQTRANLEQALAAHVADECDGDMAGAYVIVTETTTFADAEADDSVFYISTRAMQSRFYTDGLLHAALNRGDTLYADGDEDD